MSAAAGEQSGVEVGEAVVAGSTAAAAAVKILSAAGEPDPVTETKRFFCYLNEEGNKRGGRDYLTTFTCGKN